MNRSETDASWMLTGYSAPARMPKAKTAIGEFFTIQGVPEKSRNRGSKCEKDVSTVKHVLFVGHFDKSVRSRRPNVVKEIDLRAVLEVVRSYCDCDAQGVPACIATVEELTTYEPPFRLLCRIEQDPVLVRDGYLICPWLSVGRNERSMEFIVHLHQELSVDIFCRDDGRFLEVSDLQTDMWD